ncbi:MAG: macro domain-containing protein, partial [Oscillospiraceae bacterium]|nr:macro domain-containing protein [Oscillospiraceae bacterium]
GEHGEAEILRKAYASALSLAAELKCESVAFPLLSAGSYGFPKELAMSVAIQAFTEFLMSHEMQVILVVYDSEVFSLAGSLFDDVRSFIDDNYVEDRAAEERERIEQWLHEEDERRRDLREYRRPYAPRPSATAPSGLWHRKEEKEAAKEEEDLAVEGIVFNTVGAIPLEDEEFGMAEASIEEILRKRETTFTEYLRDLIRETGLTDPQIYYSAGMTRQHFNKLINDLEYQPTKRTVYQLIVGMQLDMDKAQKLLEKAGYAMSRSSKFDLIMEYYIRNRKYNIIEIDVTLFDAGLPPLQRA